LTDVRFGVKEARDLSDELLATTLDAHEGALTKLRGDPRARRKSWQQYIAQLDERLEDLRNEKQRRENATPIEAGE